MNCIKIHYFTGLYKLINDLKMIDMRYNIEFLVKLGLSEQLAIDFVENIANEAYSEGYYEGMKDEPAIVGESLGQHGMDFYEWWNINMKT
jgi:hypothetical protein